MKNRVHDDMNVNQKGWSSPGKFPKSNAPGLAHTGQIPRSKIKRRAKNKGRKMYARAAVATSPII